VSTRKEHTRGREAGQQRAGSRLLGAREPATTPEEVAQVAAARRELLLRAYRLRLRPEDLEDCYSQAVLELVLAARRGARYASGRHIGYALEQRFVSRIHDRRRAMSGRSPIESALEGARYLGAEQHDEVDIADARAEVERLVLLRAELRLIEQLAACLTADQRLVLACQVGLQMSSAEFCRRFGWSAEKYRKVAQRARKRLRHLRASEDECVPHPRGASEGGPRTR
jgi:DNA-directed RNA polymerase specialized sigma24 family protein